MQGNGKAHGNGHDVERLPAIGVLAASQLCDAVKLSQGVRAMHEQDRLQWIITMPLEELGLEVESDHFRDTPKRVAHFFREFTREYRAKPAEILKTFPSRNCELVVGIGV